VARTAEATEVDPAELLDSVTFMRSLDPLAALEAEDPELTEGVSRAAEAFIDGMRTYSETQTLVRNALAQRLRSTPGATEYYASIEDITDDSVVYSVGFSSSDNLWQCTYSVADDGSVELGEPMKVVRTYAAAQMGGDAPDDAPADDGAEMAAEAWTEDLHPRAAAGTSTGGEFAAGGSKGGAKKSSSGSHSLGYDAKSGRGAGYDSPKGNPNVHSVQQALNRLGITDANGKKLGDDGKLGPKTTAAIKEAQRRLGLAQDGKLTPGLLAKLQSLKSMPGKPATHHAAPAHHTSSTHKAPAKKAAPKPAAKPAAKKAPPQQRATLGHNVAEAEDRVAGRVVEALGTDEEGGRVFRVRLLAYGDSKNGRRYPESVMREAVGKYEGTRAYDHHRTAEELTTSTIAGLIGSYRNVEASSDGLYGDLHLLPGATHAAEAIDASLQAQAAGRPPVVGFSHDVRGQFRSVVSGGRRLQEAVQIVDVDSTDVVAKPSAGGKAVRAVAGGEITEGDDVPTKEDVLAAFAEATDDELSAVGLVRAAESTTTETGTTLQRATESTTDTERVREGEQPKASYWGKAMVTQKIEAAGLPTAVVESVLEGLPDRITESDVDASIGALKATLGVMEKAGMRPTVTTQVATEALEKKVTALDNFFAGKYSTGYRSFRQAFCDVTGTQPRSFTEDFNKTIMRESVAAYDSDGRLLRTTEGGIERAQESLTASSWNLVLGDSITRRMVAEYSQPNLQTWRQIVSSIIPVNDFRTQRIDRIGGYGTLPSVSAGAPYQPLTSPGNEEVTYAISKRGGTEDITMEMIANDDVRAIARIPVKLGLAAAQTLYRFVWDMLVNNNNIYDGTALFTTGHANYVNAGSGSALSQSALTSARILMTSQTAYGDAVDFISPTPQILVYVNDIEEIAFQLTTSAVAVPSTAAGPSNTPNLHQGLSRIRLDYPASSTAWWTIADPDMCPTFEVGFYQGRQDPELFTQSDPSVGSVFNADKVTYKIRHIYSGAVLDFRGFVKGN
jgi:peptidoglycan hydrolase-like protein with peptidoglycan-binding domain